MTITPATSDYWDVDGLPLQCAAWGIDTPGGLEIPPPWRGGPVTVPWRAGTVFTPRIPDARTITIPMWVAPVDPDSGAEASSHADRVEQVRENWALLRRTLWGSGGRQLTVTKRWDEGYTAAAAAAVCVGGLEPLFLGEEALRFTVDLYLNDPFFYSDREELASIDVGETLDITDTILGDVPTPRYTVNLAGPLTDPVVEVHAGTEVLSRVTYAGTVGDGHHLEVHWPDFTVDGISPAAVKTDQPQWLVLEPRATGIVVTGAGGGTVTVNYWPAWV